MTGETPKLGDIARDWWRQYLAGDDSAARAARARLRRAHNPHDALTEAAAVLLARRLPGRETQALALATVLAHVKDDSSQPLMRALGYRTPPGGKESEPPLMARSRFDRVMRADADDLPSMLIRLVRQLGGSVRIAELADAVIWWPSEAGRARIQRKWAFDYFAAPQANPDTSIKITEASAP
jgi:CRISPR type I-E-associated protein CasB/Cse2